MEQSVVVLGGGGFIGSHLAAFLKQKGHKVRVADVEFPEMRRKWWGKADCKKEYDLRDYTQTLQAITGYDWVIHLAADMGGVGYFTAHDYYPYINNQQINLNVLKACEELGVQRLFFSSSACIYPTHLQQDTANPFIASENHIFPANSDQMYGWDKLMMTMLCERALLDARVGIFHTIYGPGQEWEGEKAKFPPTVAFKAIESKRTGMRMKLWGSGSQLRTFCYIDDAVEKIYRILTMPYDGPVNVAGDELVSVQDTAELLCEVVGIPKQFEYEVVKPSGVLARGADNSKFERLYHYKNRYSLRKGFTEVVKWMEKIF